MSVSGLQTVERNDPLTQLFAVLVVHRKAENSKFGEDDLEFFTKL